MYLTEEQAKLLSKLAVERCAKPISALEKEALKQAIDRAENEGELILMLLALLAK